MGLAMTFFCLLAFSIVITLSSMFFATVRVFVWLFIKLLTKENEQTTSEHQNQ